MTGETDRFDDSQAAETPCRARTPSEPLITAKLYGEEPHLCADSPESRWTMEDLSFSEELYQAKETTTTTTEEHRRYQKHSTHRNTNHNHHHNHYHNNNNQLHPNRHHYNYQYSDPFGYKNTSHSEFKKFMNNNNDDMDLKYLRPPSPLRHQRTRSTSLPFLTLADLPALQKERPLRVVVLGDSGVGKSSLAVQFVASLGDYNDYESVLSENPDEVYEKTMQIDGQEMTVQIVDTPAYGQTDFDEQEDDLLKGGDAYILVYSITSRRSFKKANELRFKLQRTQETEMVPIILVGNKTDLERSREVPFEEGKHFAALFDCKLIETSASLSHNVEKLFNGVVQQIRLRRDRRQSEEEMETGSGGSVDSIKGSPTRQRSPSKKGRRQSMLKRARGAIGRLLRRKSGDEPTPGYRARSKSCHVMEVL